MTIADEVIAALNVVGVPTASAELWEKSGRKVAQASFCATLADLALYKKTIIRWKTAKGFVYGLPGWAAPASYIVEHNKPKAPEPPRHIADARMGFPKPITAPSASKSVALPPIAAARPPDRIESVQERKLPAPAAPAPGDEMTHEQVVQEYRESFAAMAPSKYAVDGGNIEALEGGGSMYSYKGKDKTGEPCNFLLELNDDGVRVWRIAI